MQHMLSRALCPSLAEFVMCWLIMTTTVPSDSAVRYAVGGNVAMATTMPSAHQWAAEQTQGAS